jgi:hypothetical protein
MTKFLRVVINEQKYRRGISSDKWNKIEPNGNSETKITILNLKYRH